MAAGDQSASRVDLDRAGGGRYDTVQDYADAKTVKVNYRSSYTVTPASADVALLDASIVPGALAVGMATAQGNGQVMAEELPGAVGTGLASVLTDEDGGYLNMVEVRDSATNDPIMTADDSTGRTVYGVLQCANGAADGAPIGAAAAENLQLSFVFFDENDALQLFAVNQTVQFGVPVVRMLRNRSPLALDEGVTMADIAGSDPVEQSRWHTRRIDITANAGAGVTVNVDTAALTGGTGGGTATVSTPYAETVELGADATEFLARRVLINGRRVGNDTLTWVSATEFTWTGELYQGDQVWIEEWKVPAAAAANLTLTATVGAGASAIGTTSARFEHDPANGTFQGISVAGDALDFAREAEFTVTYNGRPLVHDATLAAADSFSNSVTSLMTTRNLTVPVAQGDVIVLTQPV